MRKRTTGILGGVLVLVGWLALTGAIWSPDQGVLVTNQTGSTSSTATVQRDGYTAILFEYAITGACTVQIDVLLRGGTNWNLVQNSQLSANAAIKIVDPAGQYRVTTSACAGSVTVNWQAVRRT